MFNGSENVKGSVKPRRGLVLSTRTGTVDWSRSGALLSMALRAQLPMTSVNPLNLGAAAWRVMQNVRLVRTKAAEQQMFQKLVKESKWR